MADSIIIAISTESPPDSAGSERYALFYSGPDSITTWAVTNGVEPDSAFLSAWIKFQDGSFSTRLAKALFFWDPVADVEDYPATNLPASFELGQNYPNPFNPVTTIKYEIASRDQVGLVVFNTLGQPVATLVSGWRSPGKYSVSWDGIDDDNQPVATGVYFYRLQAGDITRMRKMILLR